MICPFVSFVSFVDKKKEHLCTPTSSYSSSMTWARATPARIRTGQAIATTNNSTPPAWNASRAWACVLPMHTRHQLYAPPRATPSSPDAIAGARNSNTKSPLVPTTRHSSKKNAPHSPPSSKKPDIAPASRENGTWA